MNTENRTSYKSEIDTWLMAVIVAGGIFLIASVAWGTITNPQLPAIIIGTLSAAIYCAIMADLICHTHYTIDHDHGLLIIKGGILVSDKIKIAEITAIKPTQTWLSAPALSVKHRLEVRYGRRRTVVISPRNRAAFIAELQAINPAITFSE